MVSTTPKVKPIPDGYHTITPYLAIKGASDAIAFYKKALGAEELFRMPGPDGKIMHAELQIGDSRLMLADEFPEMGCRSPQTIGGSPIFLHLYVDDVDQRVERAVQAGAKLVRPVQDQFYGDRSGGVEDPFGYTWYIATHVEDLTPEEIEKRKLKMG